MCYCRYKSDLQQLNDVKMKESVFFSYHNGKTTIVILFFISNQLARHNKDLEAKWKRKQKNFKTNAQ